jgi:hypothetical protein
MSTLSIRIPESTHENAKRLAKLEGCSLNQLIASAVAEKLAALDTESLLAARAKRGKKVNVHRILNKVPSRAPDPGDAAPEH